MAPASKTQLGFRSSSFPAAAGHSHWRCAEEESEEEGDAEHSWSSPCGDLQFRDESLLHEVLGQGQKSDKPCMYRSRPHSCAPTPVQGCRGAPT